MNELITISKQTIGNKEVNSVDARLLHGALESKRQFANWIDAKVLINPFFEEGQDYVLLNNSVKPTMTGVSAGGHNRKDYALTVETAIIVTSKERTCQSSEVYGFLCDSLGREIVIKHQKRIEFIFGEDIINNFFSDCEVFSQFPVLDGKYRIDWYIPELKLAIEFDEFHHNGQEEDDKQRQSEIEKELECRFARYTI